MPRMPRRRWYRDRRKAQSGVTLVELLVSVVIMGMALVLIVGAFSTGLLDATIAKRNTAVEAVIQYELDKIAADPNPGTPDYSECFATELTTAPEVLGCMADCNNSQFTLRADVQQLVGQAPTATSQKWQVTVVTCPDQAQVGAPVSLIKAIR